MSSRQRNNRGRGLGEGMSMVGRAAGSRTNRKRGSVSWWAGRGRWAYEMVLVVYSLTLCIKDCEIELGG